MSLSFRTNGNFIDFVNTDATSLNVETVIMKLHNTSRCIDWSLPEDTTKISFTIDEVKYSNIPITEIDFDGTVMNSQDDFETGITAMFPGLAGGGGVESVTAGDASITVGGTATEPTVKLPYAVYAAKLTQTGTDAPVATVLQNTLGFTISLARTSAGLYTLTRSSGNWNQSKTIMFISSIGGQSAGQSMLFDVDTTKLQYTTFDDTWSNIDDETVSIEIRVYP